MTRRAQSKQEVTKYAAEKKVEARNSLRSRSVTRMNLSGHWPSNDEENSDQPGWSEFIGPSRRAATGFCACTRAEWTSVGRSHLMLYIY